MSWFRFDGDPNTPDKREARDKETSRTLWGYLKQAVGDDAGLGRRERIAMAEEKHDPFKTVRSRGDEAVTRAMEKHDPFSSGNGKHDPWK